MLTKSEERRIFKEACNGYGFREVDQQPEGLHCWGCQTTHRRPTKMYTNGDVICCRVAVVHFFNPEQP